MPVRKNFRTGILINAHDHEVLTHGLGARDHVGHVLQCVRDCGHGYLLDGCEGACAHEHAHGYECAHVRGYGPGPHENVDEYAHACVRGYAHVCVHGFLPWLSSFFIKLVF